MNNNTGENTSDNSESTSNNRESNSNNNNRESNANNNNRASNANNKDPYSWLIMGALGLGAAAVVGAAYLLSDNPKKKEKKQEISPEEASGSSQNQRDNETGNSYNSIYSIYSYIADIADRIILEKKYDDPCSTREPAPKNVVITDLDSLLSDIYVRFLQLKAFTLHYKVFDTIYNDLHNKMKEVDPCYRKYSSTVEFSSSHNDKLRIKEPDEFDMDVVIRLPLNITPNSVNPNESDIILEPKSAGFIQLKMDKQLQQLPMRDGHEWQKDTAAYEWMDESNYLLCSKFIQWFESVVNRALDKYVVKHQNRPVVHVEGKPYTIEVSKSGSAMTLLIRDIARNFKMDVDLVPALEFPEERWPICRPYRPIPLKCQKDYWMVVPKPNKDSSIFQDQMRSWRIALHNQERELMYNSHNLKQTLELMKALRDVKEMHYIDSYYIETLFFWEIEEIDDENYWRNNVAALFTRMVSKFHEALVNGNIPYYWNKNNNLIANVPTNVLTSYAKELQSLMKILEDPSKYKHVAKYLLSTWHFYNYDTKFLHIFK